MIEMEKFVLFLKWIIILFLLNLIKIFKAFIQIQSPYNNLLIQNYLYYFYVVLR